MKNLYGYDNEGKPIFFDRKTAQFPHLIMTGAAGAGKHFIVKNEIASNLFYGNKEDKFIIVDVNGEYKKFVEEYGGEVVDFTNTFINPYDMVGYMNRISDMTDFLTLFTEIAAERKCSPYQKGLIENIYKSLYGVYEIKSDLPPAVPKRHGYFTLGDFCNELTCLVKDVDDSLELVNPLKNKYPVLSPLAKVCDDLMLCSEDVNSLLNAVKPYSNGVFAHKTNVNPDSRLVVIDISSVNEKYRPVALWTSLMYAWSVMNENLHRYARTWVYLEELGSYFENAALADMLWEIFKRSRRHGGIITGITHNFNKLFDSEQGRRILDNTANLVLFQQDKSIAEKIKAYYKIPDNLIICIIDSTSGGLLQFDYGNFMQFNCNNNDFTMKDEMCIL